MNEFRTDNTENYNNNELDNLNIEWDKRVDEMHLTSETDEYDRQLKWFFDEVAKR